MLVSLPEGNGMNINQQTCHHFTEGYHPAGTTPICESARGAPPCESCGDVDNRQGRDQPPEHWRIRKDTRRQKHGVFCDPTGAKKGAMLHQKHPPRDTQGSLNLEKEFHWISWYLTSQDQVAQHLVPVSQFV